MSTLVAMICASAIAVPVMAAPIAVIPQSDRTYGTGDICKTGEPGMRCLPYPGRIAHHRPNCRWVSEQRDESDQSFEVCRGRDGVWRPSGRT